MHYVGGVRIKIIARALIIVLQLASIRPLSLRSSASRDGYQGSSTADGFDDMSVNERPPIPTMPSDLFRKMAQSQLEVLANALNRPDNPSESKVESMALVELDLSFAAKKPRQVLMDYVVGCV